jgi:hypothetical protein
MPARTRTLVLIALLWLAASLYAAPAAELIVFPNAVALDGRSDRQQLLVTAEIEGRQVDLTREAEYSTAGSRENGLSVVRLESSGLLRPRRSGADLVVVRTRGLEASVVVTVTDGERYKPVSFERDVQPVMTRLGCNSGACHGKQGGQNGFQLSLLGFDDNFDFRALIRDDAARRVCRAAPARSLILLKPTLEAPHGGGRLMTEGDALYETVKRWVAAAFPRRPEDEPVVSAVEVEPRERSLMANAQQQLLVTAVFSDGSRRDVTNLTAYQSSESPIARVGEDGLVKAGPIPGETAIMVRYANHFDTCLITIPRPEGVPAEVYAALPRENFIDELVWKKHEKLGIAASDSVGDATFLRRAHLDLVGRLPTPAETREFIALTADNKRRDLVDALLERREYADFWANKWADLLRPNPYRVGIKAVRSLDRWLRDAFRRNQPYDEFVRDLITAQGSTWRNGATTVFRDRRSPEELTTMISQLFLGIRLECARCHHHPFEVWGQDDFFSFAAYFARVGRKGAGLSPPISGGEEIVFHATGGAVKHPLTQEVLEPRPLFGSVAPGTVAERPRREIVADWMTSPDNPFFAKVIVNRIWAEVMGRGLVEPVDDLRESNPPTNGPLLDALADHFREIDFDVKALLRTILSSHVYRLSSRPNETNRADTQNYSRHYRRRLRAEVLFDAVCDITDVPENFSAMPPGSRAMELWSHRVPSFFLDTFGRPDLNKDPPCERLGQTSVVQALHLMNAPRLHKKVTDDSGRAARLASSDRSDEEILEELYLLAYSRLPTDSEIGLGLKTFRAAAATPLGPLKAEKDEPMSRRRRAVEDFMWALLNTPEFLFKD